MACDALFAFGICVNTLDANIIVGVIKNGDGRLPIGFQGELALLLTQHLAGLGVHHVDLKGSFLCKLEDVFELNLAHVFAFHLGLAEGDFESIHFIGNVQLWGTEVHATVSSAIIYAHGNDVFLSPFHGFVLGGDAIFALSVERFLVSLWRIGQASRATNAHAIEECLIGIIDFAQVDIDGLF